MKRSQKGFALLEGLLIIVVLAAVGFGGWWVWHRHHTVANANVTTSTAPTIPSISIKEWGIRLTFADANMVMYDTPVCGSPNCSTDLKFIDSVTSVDSCKPILEVVQENDGSKNPSPNKQINKSSYGLNKTFSSDLETGFDNCSSATNNLRTQIRQSVSLDSISAL